ncbi:MBL fold metallo-hydrolase [Thermodesulfovibrio thiophilus]|uniref:MBL fold metallo-hydrolase n=1 Tax=Thermodesulfovibrio thiophilus TaxID=340095 RepID=UPI0017D90A9A|nr:MBL fold metallo-hydrolase [Thermodesulfovibrio thiophilus]HHW21079.1 MBL fold metallo-hydrolase [Thermodesulfovibrio thiophilus]HOA83908.1 MBL fold metallo-hydrolase [Thermodesulfovibrio thiophilus]
MFQIWHSPESDLFLCKTKIYVPDKPGLLARIAYLFAKNEVNITYFYYNRSEHPNLVLVEGKHSEIQAFESLRTKFQQEKLFEELFEEHLQITDINNILKISVYLENKPGTLAHFANLLKEHEANVVYMIYNQMISENKADIAFYIKNTEQINSLLQKMNEAAYYYSLEYSGGDKENTNRIIGLNLIERFFLKLRKILNKEDVEVIQKIINTSKYLSDILINFNKEAGRNLEAGQIFANILAFAISSRTKTGEKFSYNRLPTLPFGDILLHSFKLPTGGNIYIFQENDTFVMIDGSYGVYYEDVKRMLQENDIDPSQIKKIYISHADADHAGLSGYFEEEFGTEIFMHETSKEIIDNENRAFGAITPLVELNHYFTILVHELTECRFPKYWTAFNNETKEKIKDFSVIDYFNIGGFQFKVIESLGGHVPGQVFFLSDSAGLIFTGDYLLYVPSLVQEEKNILNIPKFLMTSTNADSRVFRKEMQILTEISKEIDERLKEKGKGLIILPGHGDYYPARLLY